MMASIIYVIIAILVCKQTLSSPCKILQSEKFSYILLATSDTITIGTHFCVISYYIKKDILTNDIHYFVLAF